MSEETGTITMKKDTLWKAATFIFAALFVISLFGGFDSFRKRDGVVGTGNVVADTNPTVNNPTPSAVKVSEDDDPILGKKDAPITIIEFSDYQCPFCRKFWQDTLPSIKKDYIDTGKVKLVYRDFPLSFHPMAIPSAQAANCAREKGGDSAYFKMHDKIFEEQNKLDGGTVQSTVQFTTQDIKKWAKDIGYDITACMDSGKYRDEVQKDFDEGGASGVQGTPGFFVNGQLISGAQPYQVFKQLIDAELAV